MTGSCCEHEPKFDGRSGGFRRALWAVIAINATMFAAEMVAGWIAGSQALKADALDFAGDTATYAITLAVIGMSLRVRSLAALAKGISLAIMGLWVLGSTLWQVFLADVPRSGVMGAVGFLALAANLTSVFLLLRYSDGDANVRSVWLCSRNDAIGNVVALASDRAASSGPGRLGLIWPSLRSCPLCSFTAPSRSLRRPCASGVTPDGSRFAVIKRRLAPRVTGSLPHGKLAMTERSHRAPLGRRGSDGERQLGIGRRPFTWYNGIALALALIWALFPIYWTVNASFKHWYELYDVRDTKERVPTPSAVEGPRSVVEKQPVTPWFALDPTIENYRNIFVDHENPMGNNETASWRAILVSMLVASVSTFFSILIGLLAAISIARYRTGGNALPFYILSFRMIPAMVIAIPFAYFASTLGPNATPFMLALIYIAYTAPLSTWLLKGFIEQVPAELEEAAMMDGMSRWQAHFRITVPLIKGGLSATTLFVFILNWTEGPLAVALGFGEWITLPVQIIDKTASPNLQAALAVLAALPPLVVGIYIRRYLGHAFTFGAIKR